VTWYNFFVYTTKKTWACDSLMSAGRKLFQHFIFVTEIRLGTFLNIEHQSVCSSFFIKKKRSKKINDEGCTSPSSGSYDGH